VAGGSAHISYKHILDMFLY